MNNKCGGPGQPPCPELDFLKLIKDSEAFEKSIKKVSKETIKKVQDYSKEKVNKKGLKGTKVLQKLLKKSGLYQGKIDGDFGPKTTNAYKKYKESRKESLGDDVLPLNFKSLFNDLTGSKKDITRETLGEEELNALQDIVRRNLKKGKSTIAYDDYQTDEVPSASGKAPKKEGKLSLYDKLTDPNYNLKTTVGRANIVVTPSDTLVVDSYDFNDAKKGEGSFTKYAEGLVENPSLYNAMRGLGTNFGSVDGEGADVVINTNQNMKKVKKLAYGGKAIGINTPQQILQGMQLDAHQAKAESMQKGQGLRMIGSAMGQMGSSMMSKGYAKQAASGENTEGVGGFMQQNNGNISSMLNMMQNMQMAYGGPVPNVPVNVEGKEVGETPQGQLIDFKGPSHDAGGIDTILPAGTEIYSDRIKVDGVTMADRKKGRKKKEMKLEDLLAMNMYDGVLDNTLKRTKAVNEKEEEADTKIQDVVGQTLNPNPTQHAYGQTVGTQPGFPELINMDGMSFRSDDASLNGGISDIQLTQGINDFSGADTINTGGKSGTGFSDFMSQVDLPKVSAGDAIGLAGNIYSAFAPMNNTNANRASDTPNINAFASYGEEGLETLNKTKQYVDDQRDHSLYDLQLSKNSMQTKNRNTARGVNTMRSLDIATNAQTNRGQADIHNAFTQQMMNIFGQEANMQNQQDQIVMQGEQNRDLADRQDKDNYFTQLAQDIATKGTGIQALGKNINQLKTNKENTAMIEELKQLGMDDNQIKVYMGMIMKSKGTTAKK